jgi:hypothetical protein
MPQALAKVVNLSKSSKHQAPTCKLLPWVAGVRSLKFEVPLELGTWDFELFPCLVLVKLLP